MDKPDIFLPVQTSDVVLATFSRSHRNINFVKKSGELLGCRISTSMVIVLPLAPRLDALLSWSNQFICPIKGENKQFQYESTSRPITYAIVAVTDSTLIGTSIQTSKQHFAEHFSSGFSFRQVFIQLSLLPQVFLFDNLIQVVVTIYPPAQFALNTRNLTS